MADEDFDLSPLRAADVQGAEDRAVAAVLARMAAHRTVGATPRRARFPAIDETVWAATSFSSPILAAAVVLSIVAGTFLLARARTAGPAPQATTTMVVPRAALALGLDATIARWAARPGTLPTAAEIMTTFRVP